MIKGRKGIYQETLKYLFVSESLNPGKYPKRAIPPMIDDNTDVEEEIEDAFTKLSSHIISKLIEEEPDSYSIEDVRVRYK